MHNDGMTKVTSRLLLTEVPSLPDGSAPADPLSDRHGTAGAIIPGTRVRVYSKPYCRKYWDGDVVEDYGLSGLVLVSWDDGTITRIGKSDLEVVR